MKKKVMISVASVALLSLGMGLSACVPPPVEPDHEFFLHMWGVEGSVHYDIDKWFAEQIEERTEGKIVFKVSAGGPLGDWSGAPERLKDRITDVETVSFVYTPGLFPLGTVTTLPGIESDVPTWVRASDELMKHELMVTEYEALNLKHLFVWGLEPMKVNFRVEHPDLDDWAAIDTWMKANVMRVHGGAAAAWAALGWSGTSVPWGEMSSALAAGIIEGGVWPQPVTGRDIGLIDLCDYYSPLVVFQFHFAMAMNLDAWNELSPEYQALFEEVAKEAREYGLDYIDERWSEGRDYMRDKGVEWVYFSEETAAKFYELGAAPVWDTWQKERGADGVTVFNAFTELLEGER